MKLSQLSLLAALAVAPAALLAQAPTLQPSRATGQTVQQRKIDQQARIAQGDRSGQLTRGETRHLESKEHAINREEHADRALDHGRLTNADKRTLDRQQNHVSRAIYRDKHNTRVR